MRVNAVSKGEGPPLVFTHGIGASSGTWDAVATRLVDRFTVVAWDLLGHGESPAPDDPDAYTRDLALADLDDVVATVDDSPVLVGHSLGGYLSLAWAITRPGRARGLVVMAAGPGFRDAERREAWNERSRRNAHRFGVTPAAAGLNLQHDGLVIERLGEISVPVLLVVGEADRPELVRGMEYLAAKLPNASLSTIPGGDHAMHEGSHADEVAELIASFAGP